LASCCGGQTAIARRQRGPSSKLSVSCWKTRRESIQAGRGSSCSRRRKFGEGDAATGLVIDNRRRPHGRHVITTPPRAARWTWRRCHVQRRFRGKSPWLHRAVALPWPRYSSAANAAMAASPAMSHRSRSPRPHAFRTRTSPLASRGGEGGDGAKPFKRDPSEGQPVRLWKGGATSLQASGLYLGGAFAFAPGTAGQQATARQRCVCAAPNTHRLAAGRQLGHGKTGAVKKGPRRGGEGDSGVWLVPRLQP